MTKFIFIKVILQTLDIRQGKSPEKLTLSENTLVVLNEILKQAKLSHQENVKPQNEHEHFLGENVMKLSPQI